MCPPRWRRLLPTLALLLAACSGDDPARPKPVSVIHISPDTAYVRPGTSQQLTASARDAGGALVPRAALVWASSDTAVATVTQTGLVTARALGDAVVTAVADGVTGRSIVRVPGSPGVRILSGDGVTDTIGALLSRPLVVEVRDGRGLPLQGVRVVFRAPIETRLPTGEYEDYGQVELANLLDAGNYYPWLSGPTDILGRASAYLRFGPAAKEARVEIQVPTPGYSDTARYTIRPGNPASVRLLPAHGALYRHRSATIRASVLDRRGNSRPDSVGLAARPGLRIEGRTVTGEAFGEYWVRAIVNGRALDSTSLAVVPDGTLAVIQMDWDIALETLYLVDLDGSNRRRVRSFIFRGLQWMPDGSGVVVRVGRGGADETDEPAQFWFIAPDGAQRRVAPDAVGLPDDYPALSRDGRWIYFAGRGRIWRAAFDGGVLEQIGAPSQNARTVSPSPDGRRIAFTTGGYWTGKLYVYDVATGTVHDLKVSAFRVIWSPRGDQLAYLSETGIGLVRPDGSGNRPLTPGADGESEFKIDWSPDGEWIVWSMTGSGIQLVQVETGLRIPLRHLSLAWDAAWRP